MHRLGARALAGLDDLFDDEIALSRRRRADQDRLIGHLDMKRVMIRFGIDRDALNAQAARGSYDPAGNLAAICNKNPLEHAAKRPLSGEAFAAPPMKSQSDARSGQRL